jgi:hypothetical protein
MNGQLISELDRMFAEFPTMRANEVPQPIEIDAAAEALGVRFPDSYRDFLLRYGGAIVGPYPIYGLRPVETMGAWWSVKTVTEDFRSQGVNALLNWVIFSGDHAGNPIGFDAQGEVWIYDHDFGGVTALHPDFESYLRDTCLKS